MLDLAIARPSPLIERAIELSSPDGITDAELHRGLPSIAKHRFEKAMWDLKSAGLIVRSLERRPDKAGRLRDQVVWRTTTDREQSERMTRTDEA